VRLELAAALSSAESRMIHGMKRLISEFSQRLEVLSSQLGKPESLFDIHLQRLDRFGDQLGHLFTSYLSRKRQVLMETAGRLVSPASVVREKSRELARWGEQLSSSTERFFKTMQDKLAHSERMLNAFSFESVLERGFAVVLDEKDKVVRMPENLKVNDSVQLRFKKNLRLKARIEGQDNKKPPKKASKPVNSGLRGGQGSLF